MREKGNIISVVAYPGQMKLWLNITDSSWVCLCSGLFALTVLAFKLSQLDSKGNAPLRCRVGGEFIALLVLLFQSLQPATLM